MILRNPDWDWYKLNSSCHILFASCKYRHSTLQLRPRLFLTFGVELEIMNGLAWLLSVIRYKVIACKKKSNTKLEVWEKIPISFGFVSFSFISLVWIVWWVWLEIYIFCDILTLLRKFRNYQHEIGWKDQLMAEDLRLETGGDTLQTGNL